jgi:ribosomal protein S18 acetylase RimI-like enzyme
LNQRIVLSRASDLRRIAKCHKSAFPAALSSKLGNSFIESMLSWYVEDERGILFHIEENDVVIGYVGGIVVKEAGKPGAATSITQHSFKQFIRSFIIRPYLILHPDNVKRISFIGRNILLKLGMIKMNNSSVFTNHTGTFKPALGLVVIGVSNGNQGKGIGTELLKEFEKQSIKNGVNRVYLSVKKSNKQAIMAYTKNGWQEIREMDDSIVLEKIIVNE